MAIDLTVSADLLLVVIFAPVTMLQAAMSRVLDMTASRYVRFAGGVETWR